MQCLQFFKCFNITNVIRNIVNDPTPLVEIDKKLEIVHNAEVLDPRYHETPFHEGSCSFGLKNIFITIP